MTVKKLSIGLFGFGTVGGGVYEILQKSSRFFATNKIECEILKICVQDVKKKRDVVIDSQKVKLVSDYSDILDDQSINCIIELMGGTTDAKDVVFEAIRRGKHVITANKALIAQYLHELMDLLDKNPEVRFGYEAAVCGGIPIIHTMQDTYLGDTISEVAGIMNGTTNYMLSKMEATGANYEDVLKEAQQLGFAEANPSADVDGYDVQSKIAILAKLAYGINVDPAQVPTTGISRVKAVDFEYAKMLESTVKLLGIAKRLSDTNVSVFVSPVIVPNSNVIASVRGATNLVNIVSENMLSSAFVGQGAGRYPTANSVVSDVIQLGRGLMAYPFPVDNPKLVLESDYQSRFYVRIKVSDQVGIIRSIGSIAESYGVSIYSILQSPIKDPSKVDFVVTTDKAYLSNIEKMCATIQQQSFALEHPLFMPILE